MDRTPLCGDITTPVLQIRNQTSGSLGPMSNIILVSSRSRFWSVFSHRHICIILYYAISSSLGYYTGTLSAVVLLDNNLVLCRGHCLPEKSEKGQCYLYTHLGGRFLPTYRATCISTSARFLCPFEPCDYQSLVLRVTTSAFPVLP